MTAIEAIKTLPEVSQAKAWNDRHYITLAAAVGSRANADLRTKVWTKGSELTFENSKGYHSDAFIAAKYVLIAAAEKAGCTVRQI